MYQRVLFLAFFAAGLSACAGASSNLKGKGQALEGAESPKAASTVEKRRPYVFEPNLLRPATFRSYFQDLRAFQVGDLVTINIVETAKASKKAATKTGRDSSIDAGITNLLGYESEMGRFFPSDFKNKAMFKASMSNKFDGSGSTTRDETMTASMTARVIEVLPNGNLLIKGTREVKVNNESQFITLSGLVRPVDISPDNTVLSSFIADAKIEYTGSGPVSDKQRPGWLLRAIDLVWPF